MSEEISSAQLDGIYTFAINLARGAGTILMDGLDMRKKMPHPEAIEMVEKTNSVDIVTAIDHDVEAYVQQRIKSEYPQHGFLGEETYSQGTTRDYLLREDDPQPTWVVDPLDGTVNYTHGFPMFCVSIALVHHNRPIVGVIYAPLLNQLFSACLGRGAWLNETTQLPLLGQAVGPLPSNAPGKCIFSCEWGKDRRDIPEGNLRRKVESFWNMAAEPGGRGGKGGMVHGVRSLGSATMDLAYTAMGSFDIWWEGGCWEWDVAAGICLLREAGGLVTTANPPKDFQTAEIEEAKLGGRLYLAVRPAVDCPTETGRQSQERTIRQVWRRVAELDYTRPGV